MFRRLHVRRCATILVRPDGYLATRTDGVRLDDARRYLERWLLPVPDGVRSRSARTSSAPGTIA